MSKMRQAANELAATIRVTAIDIEAGPTKGKLDNVALIAFYADRFQQIAQAADDGMQIMETIETGLTNMEDLQNG